MSTNSMPTCSACDGFVPGDELHCPNCSALAPRRLGRIGRKAGVALAVLGGSAFAMTLMACYGRPPGADKDKPLAAPSTSSSTSTSASSSK